MYIPTIQDLQCREDTYGSWTTIIIENMKLERDEKISALKERRECSQPAFRRKRGKTGRTSKEMEFIPSASVRESTRSFKGLGVDYIIEGGQTMNPYRGYVKCH